MEPLLTEYCKVDPTGQRLLVGALIRPLPNIQFTQVLLLIDTLLGAEISRGHEQFIGHVPGTVVTALLGGLLVLVSTLQLHLVIIVCAGPD